LYLQLVTLQNLINSKKVATAKGFIVLIPEEVGSKRRKLLQTFLLSLGEEKLSCTHGGGGGHRQLGDVKKPLILKLFSHSLVSCLCDH